MNDKRISVALLAIFLPLCLCFLLCAYSYRSALRAPEEPVPVLMYHNVTENGNECNGMTVTVEKLERDLRYLAENGYTSILPRELAAGEIPEKPVMLTFDDGYRSNYELLFPLLRKYNMKATVAIIALMPDIPSESFCTWDMLREMSDSGLVEIASHSYALHNTDNGGEFDRHGTNGAQRRSGESDGDFKTRVLDDIDKSRRVIGEKTGAEPVCFAWPFGALEEDARDFVEQRFPVTLTTKRGIADLRAKPQEMPRVTVTMDTELAKTLHFVK